MSVKQSGGEDERECGNCQEDPHKGTTERCPHPNFYIICAIAPSVWSTIFPEVHVCSIHRDQWPSRPCLGMSAILGAYIGLKKARVRYYATTRPYLAVGRWKLRHCDSNFSTPREMLIFNIQECWRISQITFGLMNVIALAHHCLLSPPTSYDDLIYYGHNIRKMVDAFLWSADCILTGASSTYLTIMALLIFMIQYDFPKNSSRDLSCLRVGVIATLITTATFVTLLYQLLFQQDDDGIRLWAAASTFIELIYLIPLATGASFLFPLVMISAFRLYRTTEKSVIGARIAILGGMIVLIGVPLDSLLCYFISVHAPSIITSSLFYDAFHPPTLVFLGCDISFIGLNIWLEHKLIQELKIQLSIS